MEKRTHILHKAQVNNNCPECYSAEGLEFIFSQEEVQNKLYSKANKEVIEILHCHTCDQDIYPVKWTEDIEQVYDYHRKLAKPKNSGIKLKPLAYLLILTDALIITAIIYYLW
ncbi:MAG: hypothetical protein E2O87_02825 [Bacteroidetes bacterium]|nr:MAG: hypothetical protein E2O87_02825 [Bacteroidota bacterium]